MGYLPTLDTYFQQSFAASRFKLKQLLVFKTIALRPVRAHRKLTLSLGLSLGRSTV
jgi:hypothetical protein